jgi:hypothetical protein
LLASSGDSSSVMPEESRFLGRKIVDLDAIFGEQK